MTFEDAKRIMRELEAFAKDRDYRLSIMQNAQGTFVLVSGEKNNNG